MRYPPNIGGGGGMTGLNRLEYKNIYKIYRYGKNLFQKSPAFFILRGPEHGREIIIKCKKLKPVKPVKAGVKERNIFNY